MIKFCKLPFIDSLYFWMLADDESLTNERVGCGLYDSLLQPKDYMFKFLKQLENDKI